MKKIKDSILGVFICFFVSFINFSCANFSSKFIKNCLELGTDRKEEFLKLLEAEDQEKGVLFFPYFSRNDKVKIICNEQIIFDGFLQDESTRVPLFVVSRVDKTKIIFYNNDISLELNTKELSEYKFAYILVYNHGDSKKTDIAYTNNICVIR